MKSALMAGVVLLATTGLSWGNSPPPSPTVVHRHMTVSGGSVSGVMATTGPVTAGGGTARSTSTNTNNVSSGGSTQTTNISGGGDRGGSSGVALGLPSFSGGGQCTPVGIGPGGFGSSGGGGGLFTWESTNCRNYYIALAWMSSGDPELQHKGVALMASITPEAHAAFYTPAGGGKPLPMAAPDTATTPRAVPDYCANWSFGDPPKPECGRR